MKHKSLVIYLILLSVLCAGLVIGVKRLGEQGNYLAGLYMFTPAIAALLTRSFFYEPHFKDANLRLGRIADYVRFWLLAVGIMALSFALYTPMGAITWDFSGSVFLGRLAQQFATTGQDMTASLPSGFTPQMMLIIFFVGGLTVFNIIPGILSGLGEEFGHRSFMFPLLYRINPWAGLVGGGLIWFGWHLPLTLIIPQTAASPLWQTGLNFLMMGIGSIFTFIYLAYVYIKSKSVFVTSIAHIAMNNASQSFSYFVVVQNQLLANLGTVLANDHCRRCPLRYKGIGHIRQVL